MLSPLALAARVPLRAVRTWPEVGHRRRRWPDECHPIGGEARARGLHALHGIPNRDAAVLAQAAGLLDAAGRGRRNARGRGGRDAHRLRLHQAVSARASARRVARGPRHQLFRPPRIRRPLQRAGLNRKPNLLPKAISVTSALLLAARALISRLRMMRLMALVSLCRGSEGQSIGNLPLCVARMSRRKTASLCRAGLPRFDRNRPGCSMISSSRRDRNRLGPPASLGLTASRRCRLAGPRAHRHP